MHISPNNYFKPCYLTLSHRGEKLENAYSFMHLWAAAGGYPCPMVGMSQEQSPAAWTQPQGWHGSLHGPAVQPNLCHKSRFIFEKCLLVPSHTKNAIYRRKPGRKKKNIISSNRILKKAAKFTLLGWGNNCWKESPVVKQHEGDKGSTNLILSFFPWRKTVFKSRRLWGGTEMSVLSSTWKAAHVNCNSDRR